MASTIKATNISTPDGTGNITVDRPLSGSGASLTSLPAANLTGSLPAISGAALTGIDGGDKRNFIIDGDFTQWPEGNVTSIASGSYGAALWESNYGNTSAVVDVKKDSSVLPTVAQSGHQSTYSSHIDVTTADASVGATESWRQRYFITGSNFTHLHQQEFTLAFWVRSGITGTMCVNFSNDATNRVYVSEVTISSADTWEYKTITLTGDTSGTWLFTEADQGMSVNFVLTCGSSRQISGSVNTWLGESSAFASSNQTNFLADATKNLYFSQVGLYLGSTAPTFTSFPISTVKDQVEYYVETRGVTDAGSTAVKICMAHAIGTTTADCTIFYRTKRVVPTFALQGTITDYDYNSQTTGAVASVASYFGQTKSGATVRVNTATTTANSGGNLTGDTTAEHALIDARH